MPNRTSTLQMIGEETLEQAATVIRCLGHPLRLRLLEAMETGGQTVSELQHHTGAPHMGWLRVGVKGASSAIASSSPRWAPS
jgi:hypothetical protein